MKDEGVMDSPAPVPGVLGEAGASTGAREALGTGRTGAGPAEAAPCLGQRAYESRKGAIYHPAADRMQHKAEHGASPAKDESFSGNSREESRGMRCCRQYESGHSALAEPKLLNDMMGKKQHRQREAGPKPT